jgi:hypothetical protein
MDIPSNLHNCKCSTCCENDCAIDVSDLLPLVTILDMNCVKRALRRSGEICDFGIVWNRLKTIAVIELKGGTNIPVAKAVLQLQGGLNTLDKALGSQTVGQVHPVLTYNKRTPIPALVGTKVDFRGSRHRIIVAKSGERLSKTIKDLRLTKD